jgi:hypothetical protein
MMFEVWSELDRFVCDKCSGPLDITLGRGPIEKEGRCGQVTERL